MEHAPGKERIVILGGGVSAITAAYWLTSQPDWQERYDVTVYQMGWRLGGKCSSGRNRKIADRIEEHGLHILLGFYENTFRTIRDCYGELAARGLRSPDARNGTWEKAFWPCTNVSLCENVEGQWVPWTMNLEPNGLVPGDPDCVSARLTPWQLVVELLSRQLSRCNDSLHCQQAEAAAPAPASLHPSLWDRLCRDVEDVEQAAAAGFLTLAHRLALSLPPDPDDHKASNHQDLLWLLEKFVGFVWTEVEHLIERDATARRLYIEVCLTFATVRGILTDGVLAHGFAHIDQYNFKDWLGRHLAGVPGDHELLLLSAVVRGTYDLFFSFQSGDYWTPERPGQFAMAAGSGLHFMLQGAFAYRGAVYYRMMGGTGDVILGPMYQVLADRGVRFEFFHRVRNLGLTEDRGAIGSITMGRQVALKDPASAYQPLYDAGGLPCWPSEPLYEQLSDEDARSLQEGAINLESAWSPWTEREQVVELREGEHFDRVVLGIPVGALRFLCPELMAADPRWARMVDEIKTVKTVAAQYWLKPTLSDMGWKGVPAMMDAFVEPLNSWADHADLVPYESWPSDKIVGDMAVLCGPMPDVPLQDPPFDCYSYPAEQDARAEAYARQWLAEHSGKIWPNASPDGKFDWNLLVDLEEREGEARFQAQYYRANIDPSERYVISVPGSTQYRLRPDDSGFRNLVLCGDWTLNSINMGCVEATVESGMLASRAVMGHPEVIHGD